MVNDILEAEMFRFTQLSVDSSATKSLLNLTPMAKCYSMKTYDYA